MTKHFVAGSVFARSGGISDCIEGAGVTLLKDGAEVAMTETDAFGDFKFDRLDPGSGPYRVQIRHPSFGAVIAEAQLVAASVSLGSIELTPL